MKSLVVLPIVLLSFKIAAADEPAATPPAEDAGAVEVDPALIRNLRSAFQRLPASSLRRRTANAAAEEEAPAQIEPVDLSGNWLLTLPAGYQYRVTFDALGEKRYRLRNAACFSGIYQLNGDVLQVVEPSDERLNVFDWQLHNVNSMTLIDETGATGQDYVGATMGRQIDWDDEGLPRQVTAIGRPAVPRPRTTRPAATTARQATLIGTAFNDETHGPYLETDDSIVFLTGLVVWPEEIVGQSVRVTGTLRPFVIQDDGETLRAQQLEVQSWTRHVDESL